ncbi:alkaline phosphatase family protein [Anaerohalosphaera lusitana]|nr:alkaline phosphatase family protein [Anaerohalosphaera lusitana]
MFTAVFSALAALLTWPVRWAIRSIKGRKALSRAKVKKVVVLGLDGMDYGLAKKMIAEGKLPTFAKLAEDGAFEPLQTTVPSMSPVAWSSFQTGSNPGKHNIYDFLTRNRNTYMPKLSSVEIRGPRRILKLGKWRLPLSKPDIRLMRKGKQFWRVLGEHGIFSNILRVPITWPPEKFYGLSLSGMCVPDLRGSQGTFSYYTTAGADDEHTGGEQFRVERSGEGFEAELVGPENPVREGAGAMRLPFKIATTGPNSAGLHINGDIHTLVQGVYTDWIKIEFSAGPGVKVSGIARFLLKEVVPELKLYVTPINIDPEKPAMPVTHPPVYSTYLAKKQGYYSTLGLAEDSWALNEKIIDDADFIQQCVDYDAEREKMFFDTLDKVKQGLCVCVFDGTDRIQHAFWRDMEEDHPANAVYDKNAQRRNAVEELYKRADGLVRRTMKKLDADTLLMVISDHGFTSFRRGVDLNRWLEDQGYLVMKEGERDKKYLQGVDWERTKAYAIGLGGIYLNIRGRESKGIVKAGDQANKLREEIAAKLAEVVDPATGEKAVKRVYDTAKIYRGPYKGNAPDLLAGFFKGYRASWETAVGEVTESVFCDNTKAWSGDHCVDPSEVPGVLFCNRKIDSEVCRLMDIGPTVLDMFGVDVPKFMDGKALSVAKDSVEITETDIAEAREDVA